MFRTISILTLAMFLVGAGTVFAKRGAPKPVTPLTIGEIEYRAVHDRFSEGGIPTGIRAAIEARDVATGKVLWTARLYEIRYDQNLETDIQDIYITSIKAEEGSLRVNTEKQQYLVNLKTQKVSQVSSPPSK